MVKYNNRGAILVIALVFVVILAFAGIAIYVIMYSQIAANYKEIRRIQTLYACEAAMNYAFQSMRLHGAAPSFVVIKDTDGTSLKSVNIRVDNPLPPASATISCEATY